MRYPIFSTPHKALRYSLGQLVDFAGRMEVNKKEQIEELMVLFNEMYTLVYSHSNHEDDILFAKLDALAPGKTNHDRQEHSRLHDELDKIKSDVEDFAAKAICGQITVSDTDRLYYALCKLHSDMLVHMIEEETITQPLFWQYMTDEQLEGFRPKIMAAMSPEESALWMKYIIASHSYTFVAGILENIKQNAFVEI